MPAEHKGRVVPRSGIFTARVYIQGCGSGGLRGKGKVSLPRGDGVLVT